MFARSGGPFFQDHFQQLSKGLCNCPSPANKVTKTSAKRIQIKLNFEFILERIYYSYTHLSTLKKKLYTQWLTINYEMLKILSKYYWIFNIQYIFTISVSHFPGLSDLMSVSHMFFPSTFATGMSWSSSKAHNFLTNANAEKKYILILSLRAIPAKISIKMISNHLLKLHLNYLCSYLEQPRFQYQVQTLK